MTGLARPTRDSHLVWRDIAGEVVIAQRNNRTVRVLNKTASLIWTLADGTRTMDDIVSELCARFDVSAATAATDTDEFCQELARAGLLALREGCYA